MFLKNSYKTKIQDIPTNNAHPIVIKQSNLSIDLWTLSNRFRFSIWQIIYDRKCPRRKYICRTCRETIIKHTPRGLQL